MNSHAHAHRISFQEKMQVVHQFMSSHNLGKGLLERVDHYFTLLWGQFKWGSKHTYLHIQIHFSRELRWQASSITYTLCNFTVFWVHTELCTVLSLYVLCTTLQKFILEVELLLVIWLPLLTLTIIGCTWCCMCILYLVWVIWLTNFHVFLLLLLLFFFCWLYFHNPRW